MLLSGDRAFLPRSLFTLAADALDRMLADYSAGHVNHWPDITRWLREHANREDVIGFGAYGTSLSDNLWKRYDAETEEYEWVDARTIEPIVG